MTGPLQHLYSSFFFFTNFAVDLLPCLGSLSVCIPQFCPSLSFWTDGLTFDSRILLHTKEFIGRPSGPRCPGAVAAKQAQIITPPPPCLTIGMRCLCRSAAFSFHQTWHYALWPDISTLVSSAQRTLSQSSRDLFRYNCANLSRTAIFKKIFFFF